MKSTTEKVVSKTIPLLELKFKNDRSRADPQVSAAAVVMVKSKGGSSVVVPRLLVIEGGRRALEIFNFRLWFLPEMIHTMRRKVGIIGSLLSLPQMIKVTELKIEDSLPIQKPSLSHDCIARASPRVGLLF